MDWFLYGNGLRLERVKKENISWRKRKAIMVLSGHKKRFSKNRRDENWLPNMKQKSFLPNFSRKKTIL